MKEKVTISTVLLLALFLTLPSTILANTKWYVNGVTGSDTNNCLSSATACTTIGDAISLAHSGGTIMVASATYTQNLTIGISLNVIGSGASTTIVDGGGTNPVVRIWQTPTVVLSGLTINNGYETGVLINSGTVTTTSATISGNRSTVSGGIDNGGMIKNSTVSGNFATGICVVIRQAKPWLHFIIKCYGGRGGGIYDSGTLANNSTTSENVASPCPTWYTCVTQGGGGGIDNHRALTINNSTISGNSARVGGGINGVTTLQNSIVANNSGGNCDAFVKSNGSNMSTDGTCNFSSSGDWNDTDPLLYSLQYNGGPTQTQALLPGSPAIDAGNPSGCTDGNGHVLSTDQCGYPRPDKEDKTGCDMGAYEKQSD